LGFGIGVPGLLKLLYREKLGVLTIHHILSKFTPIKEWLNRQFGVNMSKVPFSKRLGYVDNILIKEDMSSNLKNRIWNVIVVHLQNHYRLTDLSEKLLIVYDKCFKNVISPLQNYNSHQILTHITPMFLRKNWFEVYDFVEDLLSIESIDDLEGLSRSLNKILAEENSAYRIINDNVVEIVSEEEIQEVELAIHSGFEGVQIHLSQAVVLMSNREKPDFRNVIKESISAVESICQLITGDKNATLGPALDKIESKYKIHKALKDGFDKIYGYTSDGDGIRHSLLENPEHLTITDAKFMLVACSAFVNFLIGKISELGIEIKKPS